MFKRVFLLSGLAVLAVVCSHAAVCNSALLGLRQGLLCRKLVCLHAYCDDKRQQMPSGVVIERRGGGRYG